MNWIHDLWNFAFQPYELEATYEETADTGTGYSHAAEQPSYEPENEYAETDVTVQQEQPSYVEDTYEGILLLALCKTVKLKYLEWL